MMVPPTSLRIDQHSHEYHMSQEDAWRYMSHWRRSNVVIENDTVIHGGLFVRAAILLGYDAIPAMDIDEYERIPRGINPCAEIPLAGFEPATPIPALFPPPFADSDKNVDLAGSLRRDLLRRLGCGDLVRRSDLRNRPRGSVNDPRT